MACVYTPNTDFSVKDALPPGDPQKRILGSDFDAEFNEIATTFNCKLDATDGTATGTTTFENITVTGDITIEGDTIEDYVTTIVETGTPPSAEGKHRYWRVAFGSPTDTSLQISDLVLYTGGKGFSNGQRWVKGSVLDISSATLSGYQADGGSAPNLATLEGLLAGSWAGFGATDGDSRAGIQLDFGQDADSNDVKVAISGIDAGSVVSGTPEVPDTIEFSYSDDGSTWTVASTITGIAALTGADADRTVDLPHFGNISDAALETLFDTTTSTIPKVTAGGSGGFWTFDTTIKTAAFTAVSGNYYFVAPSSGGTIVVTLPASPSAGDFVGVRHIADASSSIEFTDNGSLIEGSDGASFTATIPDSSSTLNFPHVGLVFVGGTVGWAVFQGEAFLSLGAAPGG